MQTALLSVGVMVATVFSPALAATAHAQPAAQFAVCGSTKSIFGFAPWYACLPGGNSGEPRIESINDVFLIIFPLLENLVKAGAYVAAGYMFFSIIRFIIARGNPGKAATAIEGIRDSVIGFIITLIAIAIVRFVASSFA